MGSKLGRAALVASAVLLVPPGPASLSAQSTSSLPTVPASRPSQSAAPASREPVTFNRDIAPVLFEHCSSCHRPGEIGPFSLLTYPDARRRARQIADVTARHVMPPWPPEAGVGEFKGARHLSPRQIELFRRWVAGGLMEGNRADLPNQPVFASDWQLGPPDLIVSMPVAYTTPADGGDVFRNFVLSVPISTRHWIQALEMRPGNPRVVHHARVLLDDTHESARQDRIDDVPGFEGMNAPGAHFPDGFFLGWAAGKTTSRTSFAWPLDPGTDLVAQVHLKPSGRPEPVRISIGMYFSDPPSGRTPATPPGIKPGTTPAITPVTPVITPVIRPVIRPVMMMLGSQTIDIPAGAQRYEVVDSLTLPVDVQALRIYPHAHYLARDMRVTARLPDGTTKGLLHIPEWDLNWQDEYEYAKPVDLPRGTTISMRYVFDNSASNLRNPSSPPVRVQFGSEATDEMAELLLQLLPRKPEDEPALRAVVTRKGMMMIVAGQEKHLREEPGDYKERNTLGAYYLQLGRVGDAIAQFEAALATEPHYASARYNLGVVALSAGRLPDAIADFERAIADRPEYVEARASLGIALERAGRLGDAEASYRRALAVNPDYVSAHDHLGRLLLRRGSSADAIASFKEIIRLKPGDPGALGLLAAAYAATGDLDQAAATARTAVAQAAEQRDEDLTRQLRELLDVYEGEAAARKRQ